MRTRQGTSRAARGRSAIFAAVIAAHFGGAAFAADTTYIGPAAGSWDVAANWNNGTPTLNNLAFIDNGAAGNVVVTIGAGVTRNVGTLNISAGDAVAVSNNSFLQLGGDGTNAAFVNAGTLQLNSTANATLLRLVASNVGTISGGGTIVLTGANAGIQGASASRFVNLDNLIRGQGNIGAELITFDNRGTVAADVSGATLTLDPDGNSGANSFFANTGTLTAANGGTLLLTGAGGGTFNNAGGRIIADDSSQVRYTSAATVAGGTLSSIGAGSHRVATGANAIFIDITNTGLMVGENNSDFGIASTLVNNGTISIESTGNATDLEIQNDTTISGNGVIVLSGSLAGINGVAASRLTLGAGQTVRGQGRIGQELITLTNNGLILADVSGGTITLDPDANSGTNSFLLNNGIMRATNASTLLLSGSSGGTFSNTGTIAADDNSVVFLASGASVTGGTFSTSGTGSIRVGVGDNGFFTNVTNTGLIVGENNTDVGIASSIVNNGTISIESTANATDLEIQNDTTISGTGVIALSGTLAGINGTAASRLTLGPGQTVRGQGRIGQEVITVTNNGIIQSDVNGGTLTLDPDANSGTNSFLLNNNIMRATNGGTLALNGSSGGTFNNAGTISADNNSVVFLTAIATVAGGTFTTAGTGSIRVGASQDGYLANITNNGLMIGENNSDFGIASSIVNNGTISIVSTGASTDLEIQNDTTVSGTGVIILSGPSAGIDGNAGSRLTLGPGQTLRGNGTVLDELITLTNNGVISADVSGATLAFDPDANSGTNSFLLNNGTMRATNGGILRLTGASGGTFTGNGAIIADANSTVETIASAIATVGPVSGAGTLSITGASNFQAQHYRVGTLSVSSATARIAAGGGTLGTSKVNALVMAGTARMDVNDSGLIIDYTGASPFTSIRPQIATAFGSGSWTGIGITSSSAAAASATPDKTGLGYVEATDLFTSFPAVFRGQSVDATSILIAYTLLGDANLDRTVNITDFARLAANFNTPSIWFNGDFNYDGNTNISDFALLAANFNKSLPSDLPALSAVEGPRGAAVPEPGAFSVLGIAAALKCHRRRKSN